MALQSGSDVILKIGNGGEPETFATLGGMRDTDFVFSSRFLDSTNMLSQKWRHGLDQSGIRSVTITGKGFFSDSAAEESLRSVAFASSIRNYELVFGNGSTFKGRFKITSYGRYGRFRGEESYRMTLESAGIITFTPAA